MKKGNNEKVREVECEIPGLGMFWEADECGRCVRDVSELLFLPDTPFCLSVFGCAAILCLNGEIADVHLCSFFLGEIGKCGNGMGGECCYYGDDGSGKEAGRG